MNLSKQSEDKELFCGVQTKENTMNLSKHSGDKELFCGVQTKENAISIWFVLTANFIKFILRILLYFLYKLIIYLMSNKQNRQINNNLEALLGNVNPNTNFNSIVKLPDPPIYKVCILPEAPTNPVSILKVPTHIVITPNARRQLNEKRDELFDKYTKELLKSYIILYNRCKSKNKDDYNQLVAITKMINDIKAIDKTLYNSIPRGGSKKTKIKNT